MRIVAGAFALSGAAIAGDFEDGVAVEKRGDCAAAFRLYRSAAEKGEAAAQFLFSRMYVEGRGMPKNEKEAARCIHTRASRRSIAPKPFLDMQLDEPGQELVLKRFR